MTRTFHPTSTTIPLASVGSLSTADAAETTTGSQHVRTVKLGVAHKVGFSQRNRLLIFCMLELYNFFTVMKLCQMSQSYENLSSGSPTRSDTNRPVQQYKTASGLKFRIQEVKGLYYLYSKTKGADQLHSYCAADLHLCFCICKKQVFSHRG